MFALPSVQDIESRDSWTDLRPNIASHSVVDVGQHAHVRPCVHHTGPSTADLRHCDVSGGTTGSTYLHSNQREDAARCASDIALDASPDLRVDVRSTGYVDGARDMTLDECHCSAVRRKGSSLRRPYASDLTVAEMSTVPSELTSVICGQRKTYDTTVAHLEFRAVVQDHRTDGETVKILGAV